MKGKKQTKAATITTTTTKINRNTTVSSKGNDFPAKYLSGDTAWVLNLISQNQGKVIIEGTEKCF